MPINTTSGTAILQYCRRASQLQKKEYVVLRSEPLDTYLTTT